MRQEYDVALKAVQVAESYILSEYKNRSFQTSEKSPKDFVTEADLKAQEMIVDILTKNSNYPIIAEENIRDANSDGLAWVIDPIDGTMNFINNIPMFASVVGLIDMRDFTSHIGIISLPFFKETYSALKGEGTFLNGDRLVPDKNNIDLAVVRDRGDNAEVRKEAEEIGHIRNHGCAAYELTMLAHHKICLYYDDATFLWDFAAAKAIIEGVGGVMKVTPHDSNDLINTKYAIYAKV